MEELELRCPSKMHGIVKDGLMEVKCRSKFCGASSAIVVLHYFDPSTGELKKTERYAEPTKIVYMKG